MDKIYDLSGQNGYDQEEIADMYSRNEDFHGTLANFEKIKLYHTVKRDLTEFEDRCDCAKEVNGYAPNAWEKHAVLWMDFSPAIALDHEEITALASVMDKADGTVITAIEDNGIRISFLIKDIWEN